MTYAPENQGMDMSFSSKAAETNLRICARMSLLPSVATVVGRLPAPVLAHVMSWLPGECVVNFSTSCQATVPYLHCVPALIVSNPRALPSLVRRLVKGDGIRHLRSLEVERLEPEEEGHGGDREEEEGGEEEGRGADGEEEKGEEEASSTQGGGKAMRYAKETLDRGAGTAALASYSDPPQPHPPSSPVAMRTFGRKKITRVYLHFWTRALLRALIDHRQKVPALTHLGLSQVTLPDPGAVLGLHALHSITSLALPSLAPSENLPPRLLPAPLAPVSVALGPLSAAGTGVASGASEAPFLPPPPPSLPSTPPPASPALSPPETLFYRALGEEVLVMTKLRELNFGCTTWDALVTAGFFEPPLVKPNSTATPAQQIRAAAAAAAAKAAAARAGKEGGTEGGNEGEEEGREDHPVAVRGWRLAEELRSVDFSGMKDMDDPHLVRLLAYIEENRYFGIKDLNLSLNPSPPSPFLPPPRLPGFLLDLTPLAAAFLRGVFRRLRVLDLSFQRGLSDVGLAHLAYAWLLGPHREGEGTVLEILKLRETSLGLAPLPGVAPFPPQDSTGLSTMSALLLPHPASSSLTGLRLLGRAMGAGRFEKLKVLDLRDNALGCKGVSALCVGLHREGSMPCLESLDLSMGGRKRELGAGQGDGGEGRQRGGMGPAGCTVLCAALLRQGGRGKVGQGGGGEGRVGGCRLRRLGLGGHLMGVEGVEVLLKVLRAGACPALRELDLTDNALGDEGACLVAEWLRGWERGREEWGGGAQDRPWEGKEGKEEQEDVQVTTPPPLRQLLLGHNGIAGALFAVHPLFHTPPCPGTSSLAALNLEGNLLASPLPAHAQGEDEGHHDLRPCLQAFLGPSLRHLSLAHNPFIGSTPASAAALGRLVREYPGIEHLNLTGCGLGRTREEESVGVMTGKKVAKVGFQLPVMLAEIQRPLALSSLLLRECGMHLSSLQSLCHASDVLRQLATVETDGQGGEECSAMFASLLASLTAGQLPGLKAVTFLCLDVDDDLAWRQSRVVERIERLRPWMKAYVSWPVGQAEMSNRTGRGGRGKSGERRLEEEKTRREGGRSEEWEGYDSGEYDGGA